MLDNLPNPKNYTNIIPVVHGFITPQARGFQSIAWQAFKPLEVLLCVLPCCLDRSEAFNGLLWCFWVKAMYVEFSFEHTNLKSLATVKQGKLPQGLVALKLSFHIRGLVIVDRNATRTGNSKILPPNPEDFYPLAGFDALKIQGGKACSVDCWFECLIGHLVILLRS
jgi:hypothetical protein